MSGDRKGPHAPGDLRKRAEERLRETLARGSPAGATEPDLRALVHELQVHQVELEMQNEELKQARDVAAALFEKYLDLYDFAPVAYFTLAASGEIRSANLAGASLLGVPRSELAGKRLAFFLAPESRTAFADFLSDVMFGLNGLTCNAILQREGGGTAYVQLGGEAFEAGPECRVSMVDVTERRRVEEELARHRDHLEDLVMERTAEVRQVSAELEAELAWRRKVSE